MNMLNLPALFDAADAYDWVAAGDDTPVMLFVVIGIVALILVIAAIVLGKMSKKK